MAKQSTSNKPKSTKSTVGKSSAKPRAKRPNINQVRAKIRDLAREHQYDEQVLLAFAEFVNGAPFPVIEPSMNDLKQAVIESFGCKSYDELKKNGNFKLFVSAQKLKMTNKEAWLMAYRKFVGLPDSERDAIGDTSINGVDVLRNFLPWKVFDLDPKQATAEDIKTAFNKLAMQHHPDKGGSAEVFDRLKEMRDSLLTAY